MLQDVLDTAKEKMKKSCAVYEQNLMGLRAGRANPQLLDRILVDYYGTPTPIPQIGNISSPEPRLLVIAPWEAKMIPQVEKAIQKSDLGLNPSNDGKIIRLVFPELNEERRDYRGRPEGRRGRDPEDDGQGHQGSRHDLRQERKGDHGGLTGDCRTYPKPAGKAGFGRIKGEGTIHEAENVEDSGIPGAEEDTEDKLRI